MAIRSVLKMGDARLFERAKPVSAEELGATAGIIEDMVDTMRALIGAGLAAPQIGVIKRIVIFEIESNPRYPNAEPIPFTVLINPEVYVTSYALETDWEGCLSVPGMRGLVDRYQKIHYSGIQPDGSNLERDAEGFHARVVQHECDHLDGILYPMRIKDMRNFGFENEILAGTESMTTPIEAQLSSAPSIAKIS